jgi:hypothetical protein
METISLNRYTNNYIYIPVYNIDRDHLSFVCCLEDIPMLYNYARWNYEKEAFRFIKHMLDSNKIEIYDCIAGYITNIYKFTIPVADNIKNTNKTIIDTKNYLIDVYGEDIYKIFVAKE